MTIAIDHSDKQTAMRQRLEAVVRGKAKPPGALGRIEELAIQIGLVTASLKPDLGSATMIVFAGDHGITAEGVTAYPSVVTAEIAKLILTGGAGINVCARAAGTDVWLVDAGLLAPLAAHPRLLDRRIASGTANARHHPAMSQEQCEQAIKLGEGIALSFAQTGSRLFAFGEVGIGNSSAAALVAHAVTGIALETLVGMGAGEPPAGIAHKRQILQQSYARAALCEPRTAQCALEALRQFAGFEMVMMAGALRSAARRNSVVVVDGFIATAVAAAVFAIDPLVQQNCIFAHCSAERGHRVLLDHLGAAPLLNLDMRLGEGTGAALALPMIRAAEGLLRDMADLPGQHPK